MGDPMLPRLGCGRKVDDGQPSWLYCRSHARHGRAVMPEYSPILSILTAAFELGAAAWVLRARGRPEILRPVAAILFFLAGYQLVEVFVCRAPEDTFWARLAFADVVWLPPLGCLLIARLGAPVRRVWRVAVVAMYAIAAFWTVWVFVDPSFVTGTVCQAVIAMYIHPTHALEFYGAFYHLGLWAMIVGGMRVMLRAEASIDRHHAGDAVLGTVAFIVLALMTEIVFPGARNATPSVMCHYGLMLALTLTRLAMREHRAAGAATAR